MGIKQRSVTVLATVLLAILFCTSSLQAQTTKSPYPSISPLSQYLIPNENVEIALARTAAPASISKAAAVMVLRRSGYKTVVPGTNGFVCIVERSWANATDARGFWDPKLRAPNCFNSAAAKTFLPIYLMKTKLVLAGKSKAEILAATTSALDSKEIPPLAPGAMCYMMSKQQRIGDSDTNWHPHLMFFVSGNAAKSWGANLPGSPLIAADDPQERVTIFMMLATHWADGSSAPPISN